jgi:hypothetical protein
MSELPRVGTYKLEQSPLWENAAAASVLHAALALDVVWS